ncbi:MAG: DUF3500 domain-containing protein [Bacteroidota bacterium]
MPRFKKIFLSVLGVLVLLVLVLWLRKDTLMKKGAAQYFADKEQASLDQPFRGIETPDGQISDLFPIQSTGVSTEPVIAAAEHFINTLSEDLRDKTMFPIDDQEWRKWCNVDNGIYTRQGISLKEMNVPQKEAAFSLLQASLSAKGLQLSRDIMKTDQTLREINDGSVDFDEELYFLTLMGTPSDTAAWGWQLDGHHLVINYFVLGDQVVMTPTFMGAEPVFTTSGKYEGNTLFQDEQNEGLAFMRSLSAAQQQEASLLTEKIHNHNQTEAFRDNETIAYEGLPVSSLSGETQSQLLDLIAQYVNNIREGHQQVKMEEVKAHLNDTWFAWVGGTDETSVFYYRIHSPVVLIEFDHQKAVGVPSETEGPTRNHIHTVVRTPNGNDYGKDLLRQHLEMHRH